MLAIDYGRGRIAFHQFEHVAEIRNVAEAAPFCDLRNGESAGCQQHLRVVNPDHVQIFLERASHVVLEQLTEIHPMKAHDLGHSGQVQLLGIMLGDVCKHLAHALIGPHERGIPVCDRQQPVEDEHEQRPGLHDVTRMFTQPDVRELLEEPDQFACDDVLRHGLKRKRYRVLVRQPFEIECVGVHRVFLGRMRLAHAAHGNVDDVACFDGVFDSSPDQCQRALT